MRLDLVIAALAAALLAFGPRAPASAQNQSPTQSAQAVSGQEANRRGDAAYEAKDYAEAMRWYRESALQEYPTGEANIGYLYSQGLGVPKNDGEAVFWYRKAAQHGQREAQYNLGLRYAGGRGVEQDLAQARYWMEKSAAQGDASAQKWLQEH